MTPTTVVCGPPGSGKTAYVAERAKWGDLIIDLDTLFVAMSGQPMYDKPDNLLPFVCEARDAVIRRLSQPSELRHAWIIMGGAKRDDRAAFKGAEVVVLAIDPLECIARIAKDARRSERWQLWEPIVRRWWDEYEA